MLKEDCFYLGKITKKHGFKGNLIAHLDTDEPELYHTMESVFVEKDGILIPFFFENCQPHNNGKLLIKFEDLSAEEAENMVGRSLYLPLSLLPQLSGTDFYYHEVIHFKIIDQDKNQIGEILSINDTAAQAFFEVNFNNKQILIPMIDEWILEVNHAEKFIQINLPEGLLDIYI